MTRQTFVDLIAQRRNGRWAYSDYRAPGGWRTSRSLRSLYRTYLRLNVRHEEASDE